MTFVRRSRVRRSSWAGRLRELARENRGVAVLEAAIITPVFFSLILGIAEIGLCMNDYLAVSNATRVGARVASSTGADLYSDYWVLTAVESASTALQRNKLVKIVVYKPSAYGEAPTSTCQAGTPTAGTGTTHTGACNVYDAADLLAPKANFGCLTTQTLDQYWCPTVRKITLTGAGTDYVGVWMQYNHPWLTRMFGSTRTLTDQSVIRLEPRTQI
ncbi:MAG: hypothetical protein JWM89_3655 [Acidimicrobiales bacterium]|nr:hypothetical protein [Acidimicrobiales bacterium]